MKLEIKAPDFGYFTHPANFWKESSWKVQLIECAMRYLHFLHERYFQFRFGLRRNNADFKLNMVWPLE